MHIEQAEKSAAVAKVESIIRRRQQGTEQLQRFWKTGELGFEKLPCLQSCTGQIVVQIGGESVQGRCPVYMEPGVCPLAAQKEREVLARLKMAGFGPRYHHIDPERIRARGAVEEYLGKLRMNIQAGRGMVVTGDVGVGKTMMLAYMAKKMIEADVGVWRTMVSDLVTHLISKKLSRGDKTSIIQRAMTVEVLMWDDLGSGDMPPWVLGVLESIAEHRYANQKPLIVATNMTREALVESQPLRRMVDRWRQSNMMVSVGGTSQRHA